MEILNDETCRNLSSHMFYDVGIARTCSIPADCWHSILGRKLLSWIMDVDANGPRACAPIVSETDRIACTDINLS